MRKEMLDYLNCSKNAVLIQTEDNVSFSREKIRDSELVYIEIDGKEYSQVWRSNSPKIDKPKHTGGKPSYIKVMLKYLMENNVSFEGFGFFGKLYLNVNWGNNLLIDKKSKKPLTFNDISRIMNKSRPTLTKIIKELMQSKLLFKDNEGYKVSPNLLQKGGEDIGNRKTKRI